MKYFRRGWKMGLALGGRGLDPGHGQQQFDEGGEVTVEETERLFFPGALPYDGQVLTAADLATRWSGGKASHLYEALRLHWRTRRGVPALQKLVRAAAADVGPERARGMALVTGR